MVNWDRKILGQAFSHQMRHISRQALLDFVTLMGTTNPIYYDPQAAWAQGYRDIIAMPAYMLVHGSIPLMPPALDFHGMGINAGYECTFFEVVYPDDTLTFSTCLVDMYEKTGRSGVMRFVVRETTVTNQHGETVAVVHNPFILDW